MSNIRFETDGFDNIIEKLKKMGREGEKINNRALKKSGELLLNESKNNVRARTGNLQEELKTSEIKTKNSKKYISVGLLKNNSKIFYGKMLEFGASPHLINITKGRFKGATLHHPGISPPKPFLGPAYESKKDEIKELIINEIKEGLGLK